LDISKYDYVAILRLIDTYLSCLLLKIHLEAAMEVHIEEHFTAKPFHGFWTTDLRFNPALFATGMYIYQRDAKTPSCKRLLWLGSGPW